MSREFAYLNVSERKAFWQEHIKQFKKTGLSQSEYCRVNQLKLSSFNTRLRASIKNNQNSNSSENKTGLVEVTDQLRERHSPKPIRLVIADQLSIEVESGYDEMLLTQLLSTLGVSLC